MNSNVTILERFFDKLLAQNCRVKCIKLKVKKKKKNEYLKFFPIIFLPTILSKKFHAPTISWYKAFLQPSFQSSPPARTNRIRG